MIPLVLGVVVLVVVFWLCVLVDVLSWPRTTWDAAGLSKGRWVLRVALLGWLGAALYLASPRRELKAAYRRIRWGGTGPERSPTPRP